MNDSDEYFSEEFSPTPMDPDEFESDEESDGGDTDDPDESIPYNLADFQSPEERAAAEREKLEEEQRREHLMIEQAIANSLATTTTTTKTTPVEKKEANDELDVSHSLDEGKTCQICFDNYSASGDHRCSCLPCGHVFGKRCIEQWLSEPNQRKCPICKAKCETKNVVVLFLKCFASATESGECDELRAELARSTDKLARAAEEAVRSKRRVENLEREIRMKEEQMRSLRTASGGSSRPSTSTSSPAVARKRTRAQTRALAGSELASTTTHVAAERTPRGRPQLTHVPPAFNESMFDDGLAVPVVIDLDPPLVPQSRGPTLAPTINLPRSYLRQSRAPLLVAEEEGKARAMCHYAFGDVLFVACPLVAPFSGYGYKKVHLPSLASTSTTTAMPCVRCHTGIVRHMTMSPGSTGYVLTGGMDRLVVETKGSTGDVMMTIRTPSPVFCCAYSTTDNSRRFVYAGGADGVLRVYDCASLRTRENGTPSGNHTRPALEIHERTLRSGIFDLVSVAELAGHPLVGVLVMRMDCVRLYTLGEDNAYDCHVLMEGRPKAITWSAGHLLVTLRPHGEQTTVENQVHRIVRDVVDGRTVYTTTLLSTFARGLDQSALTRTALDAHYGYVVEDDEIASKLHVFRWTTGELVASTRLSIGRAVPAHQVVTVNDGQCVVLAGGRLACYELKHGG